MVTTCKSLDFFCQLVAEVFFCEAWCGGTVLFGSCCSTTLFSRYGTVDKNVVVVKVSIVGLVHIVLAPGGSLRSCLCLCFGVLARFRHLRCLLDGEPESLWELTLNRRLRKTVAWNNEQVSNCGKVEGCAVDV